MKVGILTFHYAYNYGAVLQAYGLQETLRQMGVEPVIVDYRSPAIAGHNRGRGLRSGKFMTVIPMRRRFDKFRKEYLTLTKCIKNHDILIKETKALDAMIVGSDQVWNIKVTRTDTNYFLGFIDNTSIKKISYAACFGQPDQDPDDMYVVSGLLAKFDRISVRNRMSADLVKSLCGTIPTNVLDPTMLTKFDAVTLDVAPRVPYILVHAMHHGKDRDNLTVLTKKAQSHFKLPVYSVSQQWDFPVADYHVGHIGPGEWLSYYNNATIVYTDSFHGLIFAIKNRKPFIVTCANDKSTRILELADRYGFMDRVVINMDITNMEQYFGSSIDFDRISESIDKDIQHSMDFLNDSLLQNQV